MTELSWEIWLIIGLSLGLGGLAKGLTGLGLPALAIPVMALFIGVEKAVVMLIIPSLVLNGQLTWSHRDCAGDLPELRRLLVMGFPGAVVGAGVLYLANEQVLATVLAVGVLVYLTMRMLHPEFSLSAEKRHRWAPVVGFATGSLQASTGISAPVVAPYVDSLGLNPRSYVFAVAAIFSGFSAAHFAILLLLQAYTVEQLMQSVAAVVPAILFMPVGTWLRKFVSPHLFTKLIRILLLIMSLRLLYGAWLAE